MPSYHSMTGKRLSGAAQRKRKRASPVGDKTTSSFYQLPAPPLAQGVEACVSWANDVGLLCIATASHAEPADLVRVRVVSTTLAKLGMLKDKALRSEQAVRLRSQLDGVPCNLLSTKPPLGDVLAAVAWAYFQLVNLLYEQCQADLTDANLQRWDVLSTAVARLGYVKEQAQTAQLARRYQAGKKTEHSMELTHVGALRSSPAARV